MYSVPGDGSLQWVSREAHSMHLNQDQQEGGREASRLSQHTQNTRQLLNPDRVKMATVHIITISTIPKCMV